MSKTLILMRHAKAGWTTPAGGDFARPLSPQGQKEAVAMGARYRSPVSCW